MDQFQVVTTYHAGSKIIACPSDRTYNTEPLTLFGDEGGPDRVFINDTSWYVIVVTMSKLTVHVIDPVKLLHARLGRIAPSTRKVVVHTELQSGSNVTEQHIYIQRYMGPCAPKPNTRGILSMHTTKLGWMIMWRPSQLSLLTRLDLWWKRRASLVMSYV